MKKISEFQKTLKRIKELGEEIRADRECRQLEIIANSLMKRFKIDEVEALTKGLDILDDLKEGGLIK